jgi:hypothetical protein
MNERTQDLFAVEPAEFVRARDALAKELRASGHEAEAKEVAALRRPTAPVWAVNQLARKNKADLENFLEASERVRHAQVRGASGDDLRTAMAAQRGALAKLEQAAAEVLRGSGAQANPGALRTVQSTLQAAGSGPADVRQQLLHGTLREALEASGFDSLLAAGPMRAAGTGHAAAAGSRDGKPSRTGRGDAERNPTPQQQAKERRAEEREAKRQAAEARKRDEAARAAEKQIRKLETRAAAAEEAARKAREALDAAKAELERLRK